jgi:hypothetical protein
MAQVAIADLTALANWRKDHDPTLAPKERISKAELVRRMQACTPCQVTALAKEGKTAEAQAMLIDLVAKKQLPLDKALDLARQLGLQLD